MKREGRQHGMVRTYYILPPPLNLRRDINLARTRIDSPATAGLFTKVSPKPTNHSKFTGKCRKARCGGCHMHPVCKSNDKTKGNHKHRSADMRANYQVMDGRPGLNFSGFSASAILDHLASNHHDHDEHDEVDDNDDGHGYDSNHVFLEHEKAEGNAEEDKEKGSGGYVITQDDDKIGFSNEELELDYDEVEEGWSLVGVV